MTEENGAAPHPDWPYRFEVVPLERFMVDEKYQRDLTSLVEEIEADFDPAMVGTLIGSERKNGKIALVDGQTRFEGARRRGDPGALPALIYTGMTREDEALLFARLQRKRRSIQTWQRFQAELVAKQKTQVDIAKILKDFGLEVGPRRDRDVQAVTALESVYARGGKELLRRVILILHEAWAISEGETTRDAFSEPLIRGVARLMQANQIDDARLVKRLAGTTPTRLRQRAAMLREGKGGGGNTTMYIADALLTEYSRRG